MSPSSSPHPTHTWRFQVSPGSCARIFVVSFVLSIASFGLTGCAPASNSSSNAVSNSTISTADANSNTNTNQSAVYQTYGVHNPPDVSPCQSPDCVYKRNPGEPPDPTYPEYWVSGWNMYRVYNNFEAYPPPYNGVPPAQLKEGVDYEKSWGTTYYDSTTTWPNGAGAMMEHYDGRCLPIFPLSNKYTCSFISLGKTAYFVTYDKDRPAGMPPVCLFSGYNHPPQRDFIKHLPYSPNDSSQIGPGGQGYSFWVSVSDGKVFQAGVKPLPDISQYIMFGYGFAPSGGQVMPQSFYFSGYPMPPANAPFVSQNYVDFKAVKPDPTQTWDQVSRLDPATLPQCQLFDPPQGHALLEGKEKSAPTWGDIGRWKKAAK